MYYCPECDSIFENPDGIEICEEIEAGVEGWFPDRHYRYVSVCPTCGTEEIEEVFCGYCSECEFKEKCNEKEEI